jgi:hypothetical protein
MIVCAFVVDDGTQPCHKAERDHCRHSYKMNSSQMDFKYSEQGISDKCTVAEGYQEDQLQSL